MSIQLLHFIKSVSVFSRLPLMGNIGKALFSLKGQKEHGKDAKKK
jgi:hypothetical protein